MTAEPGIVLVDKPAGKTSHDVVARARRVFATRKVGHAGTLDPMATGLLVLGVNGATRLLTYLVGLDKTYRATVRLGVVTDTDDAEGAVLATADASGVDDDAITAGIADLTGRISQVPSSVSAIKIGGRRAYDLARAGEQVQLAAREVTVSRFQLIAHRRGADVIDLDVEVDCASGTYVRALARDLGAALGVGGHLTALRRTRVGPFEVTDAGERLEDAVALDPATAMTLVLGRLEVTADQARDLRHGKRLRGVTAAHSPIAAVGPDGALVGIVQQRGDDIASTMNMPEVTSK